MAVPISPAALCGDRCSSRDGVVGGGSGGGVSERGDSMVGLGEEKMVLVKEGVVRKALMTVSCQDLAALEKWCGDPSVLTDS